MEIYLLKSGTCLAILFLFYKLFLEKENLHKIKRYYLLGILVMSFGIPLITFTTYTEVSEITNNIHLANTSGLKTGEISSFIDYLPTLLLIVYFIGVAVFSIRFGKNLLTILIKINRNQKLKVSNFINVLLIEKVIPHTFFNYIFLNKQRFESQEIPEEVLVHEQAHAKQKHSIDLLIIEFLQIVFWFNPFLYFIKNSIKLNHEFLADQAVLNQGITSKDYQKILLAFSSSAATPILANSINYSLIKKRFTVMKKHTSKRNVWIRSLLLFPLLAVLIFSFSSRNELERDAFTLNEVILQKEATKAQLAEYNKLAKKYNTQAKGERVILTKDIERLEYLYRLMSKKQKSNAVPFPNIPPPPPPAPDKAPEPMRVKKGVNDKDLKAPPPPKAPKPVKVIKGENDTEANIPPPPPKEPKDPKPVKDPIKHIEKLADEGARFLFFDGGPHHKNGMDISKEKAIDVLKNFKEVTVNIRDDNYIYQIVEIRLKGC